MQAFCLRFIRCLHERRHAHAPAHKQHMPALGQRIAVAKRRGDAHLCAGLKLRHMPRAGADRAVNEGERIPFLPAYADRPWQKMRSILEVYVHELPCPGGHLPFRQAQHHAENLRRKPRVFCEPRCNHTLHPIISFCMAHAASRAASAKSLSPYFSFLRYAAMIPREEFTMQPRRSRSKKPRISSAVPPCAP